MPKFRSGNPGFRINAGRECCPITRGEFERDQRRRNLNPNRTYRPPWSCGTRIGACGCGPDATTSLVFAQTAFPGAQSGAQAVQAGRRALAARLDAATVRRNAERRRRTQRPCAPLALVRLCACDFADALWLAYQHQRYRSNGPVQDNLARGVRYSLSPCDPHVIVVEAPETTYRLTTCASDGEVLAALPGACRATSRCDQRRLQNCIGEWWLGADGSAAAQAQRDAINSRTQPRAAQPLDPARNCLK